MDATLNLIPYICSTWSAQTAQVEDVVNESLKPSPSNIFHSLQNVQEKKRSIRKVDTRCNQDQRPAQLPTIGRAMSRAASTRLWKDVLLLILLGYSAYSLLAGNVHRTFRLETSPISRTVLKLDFTSAIHRSAPTSKHMASVEICTMETRKNPASAMARMLLMEYATRQNYTLTTFDSTEKIQQHLDQANPKWYKYHALINRFNALNHSTGYPLNVPDWTSNHWVFWMDGDVLITNATVRIETFVTKWAEASTMILVSRDPHATSTGKARTPLNVGVLGVRFSSWTYNFLDRVIKQGPTHTRKIIGNRWTPGLVDQPSFTYILEDMGELCDISTSKPSLHLHVTVLPLRQLQSICRWGYKDKKDVLWKPGDFAAHVTGMSKSPDDREKVMKLLLDYSHGSSAGGMEAETACKIGFDKLLPAQPSSMKGFVQSASNLLAKVNENAHAPAWEELERLAKSLFHENPGQMSYEQYMEIVRDLYRKRPCNMLVWGAGNDIWLWAAANAHGNITVLESDKEWLQKFVGRVGQHVVFVAVSFKQQLFESPRLIKQPSSEALLVSLPQEVSTKPWDTILIDGPAGNSPNTPGRMESIYTTGTLVTNMTQSWPRNVTVFVHDASRKVEQCWADTVFGKQYTETYGKRKLDSPTSLRKYILAAASK